MKKFAALFLALVLVFACTVSAMANADQWVDIDLTGYKVVYLFNYNETVAINVKGSPSTPGEAIGWYRPDIAVEETYPSCPTSIPKNRFTDTRYVVSSILVAGYEAREIISTAKGDLNVVPVDLTVAENTAFVYPIVTKSNIVIGLLYAKVNVEEGYLQVEGQLKEEIYSKTVNTLTIYTTKHQVLDGTGNDDFPFAEPISIEEELGGVDAVLLSIGGRVTYPTLFGNMKSGKTLAYQDYFRNEGWVRAYRNNMDSMRAKVAFR